MQKSVFPRAKNIMVSRVTKKSHIIFHDRQHKPLHKTPHHLLTSTQIHSLNNHPHHQFIITSKFNYHHHTAQDTYPFTKISNNSIFTPNTNFSFFFYQQFKITSYLTWNSNSSHLSHASILFIHHYTQFT